VKTAATTTRLAPLPAASAAWLAAALLALAGGAGCPKNPAPPAKGGSNAKPAASPAGKAWSAEEMAKDPAGYMQWADRRISTQVADRQGRLQQLSARLLDVNARREKFLGQITDVENIHKRMKEAVQRAEDEDRWPAVVAGRSFDQAKANAVIEQSKKWLDERRGLAQAYDQAVARLTQGQGTLQKDIEALYALKEKLQLDLERVRLTQGMEELGQVRQREEEIAGFAKALTQMADDSATINSLPPDDKTAAKVDIDSFLK
jgi:chromosome segregation ATPase